MTALKINGIDSRIILINIYFPFYEPSKINERLAEYAETIGIVDSIVTENNDCSFVLLADFNCNVYDKTHAFSKMVKSFTRKWNLVSAFDLDPMFDSSNAWTRHNAKSRSQSFLDCIFVSQKLLTVVTKPRIVYDSHNVSDHFAIEIDLELIMQKTINSSNDSGDYYINWKKLSSNDKNSFSNRMTQELDKVLVLKEIESLFRI